jgi:hypothetical protein
MARNALQNRVVARTGDGRFDSFPSPPIRDVSRVRLNGRLLPSGDAVRNANLLTDC